MTDFKNSQIYNTQRWSYFEIIASIKFLNWNHFLTTYYVYEYT